ncbi:MAG: glycosyltransferase [Betaproteobacteria bacterium]|nr:glycosyltransferase [Betaproteobacteria bacterium]
MRDSRIRYIRQPENIGLPRNWNAMHAAKGELFRWASASDYCAPTMLEKCVAALRADPGVVLCYGKTEYVDEHGKRIEIYEGDTSFEQVRPSERFEAVSQKLSRNNPQCGLVRLGVLKRTGLDRTYPAGDMVLMAELALHGKFKLLPEVMLFRRQSPATLTSMLSPRDLQRAFNPKSTSYIKMLRLRWHMDAMSSIWRSPVSLAEKFRASASAIRYLRWERAKIWREFLTLFSK